MDRAPAPAELRRLFARTLPSDVEIELGADAAAHARVLRLAAGDHVQLFDGRGHFVEGVITHAAKGTLRARSLGVPQFVEREQRVVLVQCLPKSGKLDDIVRMTSELGVAEIALAVSEYCVAKATREEQKIERLERVAIEAARQAEQAYVPVLHTARPLAEVLARAPQHAYRAAFLERSEVPLPAAFPSREVWLVVGPEGGLSSTDRAALTQANFIPSAIGRSILRTETAAVVGVALALERLGRCA
ncbi:MAG TPA: RsmE family RNA methyltransferase [Polyangiales bacterium]|nr:RsmE family RNA methyltransferase [Polyangiales bacterium]